MREAAKLVSKTRAPVINPPRATMPTGRAENAKRLAHIPCVRTARTVLMARGDLCGEAGPDAVAAEGLRFPLLLRSPGFHTGQNFEFVDAPQNLTAAAARLPGDRLLAMDYLDARGPDGMARKYRVMFVNGEILPLHLAISHDWKVHYFSAAMAERDVYRAEEERFLNNMPEAIGARAMAALTAIRDTLGLDYAGIDFGLDKDGALLLFETNATMVIVPPGPDPRWDYRRAAIARVENAARAMLVQRASSRTLRAA